MNETNTNTTSHHGRDQEVRIYYRQAGYGDHGMRLPGQYGLRFGGSLRGWSEKIIPPMTTIDNYQQPLVTVGN
jgi:hypothetical protein